MPYNVNKFNGDLLTTVNDGKIDATKTSIKLLGRGVTNYGEVVAENFVHMLENFAREEPPANPLVGQLWYDKTQNILKVCKNNTPTVEWATVGGLTSGSSISDFETTASDGQLFWDGDQLWVYDESENKSVLVGPLSTPVQGTKLEARTTSGGGANHNVMEFWVDEELVAVWWADPNNMHQFTPDETSRYTNFPVIYPGLTISNQMPFKFTLVGDVTGSTTVTHLNDVTVDVTVTDDSHSHDGRYYTEIECDNRFVFKAGDTITGDLTVQQDLTVNGNLTVSGTQTIVESNNVHIGDNILTLNSDMTGTPTQDAGIEVNRGDLSNVKWIWDESNDYWSPNGNNIGNVNHLYVSNIHGIGGTGTIHDDWILAPGATLEATYADLAERYATDMPLEAGDLVRIGGEAEITKTTVENDEEVFGVVSTSAAFKMNSDAGSDETHPYIALSGRVRVKCVGKVRKGQRLVSSSIPGVAKGANDTEKRNSLAVFGRALEDKTTDEHGFVEVVIGVK